MNRKHCFMLIHGYQSLKADMQNIEDALKARSYEVHNVDIAGHDNASEEEILEATWKDWFYSVEEQFLKLKNAGYSVTLIGHSLGGILALALNQKYEDDCIISLVIIASPLYLNRFSTLEILHPLLPLVTLIKPFTKKIHKKYFTFAHLENDSYYYPAQIASMTKKMHEIRNNLFKIKAPILILQAIGDKTVPQSSPKKMAQLVASSYKKVVLYTIFDHFSKKHQIVTHPETKDKVVQDIFDFLEEIKQI